MAKVTRHGGASYEGVSREVEAPADVEPEVADVADEAVDVQEPLPEYAAWLITDLRDELGERGLTKSGNKDELVDRLVADDVAQSQAEPESEATEEVE